MPDDTDDTKIKPEAELASLPPSRSLVVDRKTQLAVEIRELYADLEGLDEQAEALKIKRSKCRVEIGAKLLELKPLHNRGWVKFLKGGTLGFSKEKARDCINEHYLHAEHDYKFAKLANMKPAERNSKAAELRDTDHSDRGVLAAHEAERHKNRMLLSYLFQRLVNSAPNKAQIHELIQRDHGAKAGAMVMEWQVHGLPARRREKRDCGLSIMLDSGAVSVRNLGVTKDIDTYCNFLIAHPQFDLYVNLDEIFPEEPEEAAEIGFENYLTMCKWGLDPIVVVHVGENVDGLNGLKRYLDAGCNYIGFGGAGRSKPGAWRFYKEGFKVIDNCGRPIRTHAFGVAAEDTLLEFQFTSADAMTAILRSQKFWNDGEPSIDLSRIAGQFPTYSEKKAAATYLATLDISKMERRIQLRRPDFRFYSGLRIDNDLALAALRVTGHSSAMLSFHGLTENAANDICEGIQDLGSLLDSTAGRCQAYELMRDMQRRQVNLMVGLGLRYPRRVPGK